MKYDVVALGEVLIDFTEAGASAQGNTLFEANPGGAPANMLAMLSKLGRKTAFIGKAGEDMFGHLLKATLGECGIDAHGLVLDENANTTLAFVKNAPDGDRQFSFFRKPGADTLLAEADVDPNLLLNCRVFHFGTLSLSHQPAAKATKAAVAAAKNAGALLSFDPNLRPLLWADEEHLRRQVAWGCGQAHIVKLAQEELTFLTGTEDIDLATRQFRRQYPQVAVLFVTKGKAGAEMFWRDRHAAASTFTEVPTVDTTGAGDTFFACCLHRLLPLGLSHSPSEAEMVDMLRFANAAASLVTTKKGALRVMPSPGEIEALLQ